MRDGRAGEGARRSGEAAFRLDGVYRVHDGTRVLGPVDLALPPGVLSVLLGPSGSGKTTLLRLLNRLDDPTSGRIAYLGRPLESFPVRELRRRVGFVFQEPALFPGTIRSNLEAAADIAGVDPAHREDVFREALASAELDPAMRGRDVRELSAGERQRAGLARALVPGPETLLLDEPTGALDVETAHRLLATLRALATAGRTLVMATHRLEEARRSARFVVLVDRGRVVEAGDAEGFFAAPRTERARAFLAGDSGGADVP